MKVHLLSGFLGSGKTTAIQQASSVLIQRGTRIGVITNDQGIKLVDADFIKSLQIPSRQVVNGCFCCNYNEFNNSIESLVETSQPEVIFAESVGSCTDIVATVMKPLLRYRNDAQVTVSTFADARLLYMLLSGKTTSFDEAVTYIYYKQLEEAGIIVVSKIDLMNTAELEDLRGIMDKNYRHKIVIFQNSLNTDSLGQWLGILNEVSFGEGLSSLNVDYDIYGAGEAKLAWLDQEIEIFSSSNAATADAYDLMNLIYKKIIDQKYPIGHLKFLLNDEIKISFTLTTQTVINTNIESGVSLSASLLINARVQITPDILSSLVSEAINETSEHSGCTIAVNSVSAFQPGYPKPTHRIEG